MINLDPWQKEFLNTQGDKILCTGRQVGKSVICGMDAGEYALNHPAGAIGMQINLKVEDLMIEKITKAQGFVIQTIENHLGRFVASGNIKIDADTLNSFGSGEGWVFYEGDITPLQLYPDIYHLFVDEFPPGLESLYQSQRSYH